MSKTVLVAGAGPVGLAGALSLARAGVPVRIIDRLASPTNQSRAAIVQARTMEHLQRLGCAEDFLAAGVRVFGVAIYGPGHTLLTRNSLEHLPTPYPFMLGLEQCETERLLTERLRQAGVEIEREVELTGLADQGDRVTVHLRGADGRQTTEDFSWVIGADGARSAVRTALGLHLEGETLDTTWITADVKIRWDQDPGEAMACLTPEGIAFIAAMNDDRWRVIVNSHKMTPEEAQGITLADVQKLVNAHCGTKVELYDPVWISPFGINTRMVPQMSRGRVFLAGDAAHVHSPVGGQGMNTGMQDALNLAWKMALVHRGLARPELLDSYNAERHANAKRLLDGVGPLTKIASLRNPVAVEIRNHVVRLVSQLGLNRGVPRLVSMIDVGYPLSPIVSETELGWIHGGPRAGERAPDAGDLLVEGEAERQSLYELWQGDDRHQLLVFQDEETGGPELPESPLYAVTRILRQGCPGPGRVVDAQGHAHDVYEVRSGGLYLVRPDGIIAFRCGRSDPAALRGYLEKWYPGA